MGLRWRVAAAAILVGAGASAACSLLVGTDDLTGGQGPDGSPPDSAVVLDGSGSDGFATPSDAGDSAARAPAPCGDGGSGPPMINGGLYCIDATEVTQAQYRAFLEAKAGNTTGQPQAACGWNTSYAPLPDGYCPNAFDPVGHPDFPVRAVDWCDGLAYCAWAGKRLCGRLGDGGGVRLAPPTEREWFDACSNHADGLHTYPYGLSFDPNACNGPELDAGGIVAVASLPKCAGGLPGLHDMTGNVGEWINGCEAPADAGSQTCEVAGGSYDYPLKGLECGVITTTASYRGCGVGFRCCADP